RGHPLRGRGPGRGHAAEASRHQGEHARQGHGAQGAEDGGEGASGEEGVAGEEEARTKEEVGAAEAAICDFLDRGFRRSYNQAMDRIALITGASSGFGRAAVERFVAGGWRVVACGRRAERLQALVDALGADRVHAAAFDVRDEAAMRAALAALPAGFRDVDLLVNNAGLALGTAPAQQASLDDWRTMIETNVTALVTLTHALLPALVARRGAIVNVSSIAGTYPYTGGNVYGGTKAFVTQFSLNLRSDLHGTGVRVTSIEPGMAETEF